MTAFAPRVEHTTCTCEDDEYCHIVTCHSDDWSLCGLQLYGEEWCKECRGKDECSHGCPMCDAVIDAHLPCPGPGVCTCPGVGA